MSDLKPMFVCKNCSQFFFRDFPPDPVCPFCGSPNVEFCPPTPDEKGDSKLRLKDVLGCLGVVAGLVLVYYLFGYSLAGLSALILHDLSVSAYITFAVGVSYLFAVAYGFFQDKDPAKGEEADNSHAWVRVNDRRKMRDATAREVYEHYHGVGSWWRREAVHWKTRRAWGFVICCCLAPGIPYLAGRHPGWTLTLVGLAIGVGFYLLFSMGSQFEIPSGPIKGGAIKQDTKACLWEIGFMLLVLLSLLFAIFFIIFYFSLPAWKPTTDSSLAQAYLVIAIASTGLLIAAILSNIKDFWPKKKNK